MPPPGGPDDYAGEEERKFRTYGRKVKPKSANLGRKIATDVPNDFNPLTEDINGLPNYGAVRPEHLVGGMYMVVDQFGKDMETYQISLNDTLAEPWTSSWQTFAAPLELLQDRVDRVWGAIGFLREVNDTSVDVHRAYNTLTHLLMQVSFTLSQSDDLYGVLRLIARDEERLSEARRRIVRRYLREAVNSGVGIEDAETSKSFNQRQLELAYLASLFAYNLALEDAREVHLATSPGEVAGLPAAVLSAAADAAHQSGRSAVASAEAGPWLFTASSASTGAVLRHAGDRELRRRAWLAQVQRGWRDPAQTAGQETPEGDNTWIIKRMLEVRRDWAADLGHKTFADLVFPARMATLTQVLVCLESLRNASLAAAKEEFRELGEFAAACDGDRELAPWDIPYWRERMREARSILSEDVVRESLVWPKVLSGVFQLAKRLFGVDFVPSDGEVPVWHPSVTAYRVVDLASGLPIAALTLDPFRAARKRRTGFWTEVALPYSKGLGKYGTPRRPIVHVVGDVEPGEQALDRATSVNARKLLEGRPATLTFAQLRGLLRALGEAMQELLTEQDEGLAAGRKGMELDAVGWPARFLELWAFDRGTLESLGMSADEAEAAVASQAFHSGSRLADEVRWAWTDLELHARFDPRGPESALEVARRIAEETTAGPISDQDRSLCSFCGPFSTGHAAGHYADLWAQVLAADAFGAFEEAGLGDDAAVRDVGLRLRRTVLAPGGGRAPLAAFRDFRGRPPRVRPLLQRLGLAEPAAVAAPAPAPEMARAG